MDGGATSVDSSNLLTQLEVILDSHPHIDEVGFVHPSQFAALNESKPSCSSSDTFFWSSEHKLGISTLILVPLYKEAKDAFMNAFRRYKMFSNSHVQRDESLADNASTICKDTMESEVMKHSRALVLLSCDFGTPWNSRKLVISKKRDFSMLKDELLLSTLVLSHSPKSERAWSQRRWVIKKMIAAKYPNMQEIVGRESELVKTIAENSKMNYRAWNHRCWLVSYMSQAQVLSEFQNSQDWAGLHVADNSSFHYRTRLLLQLVEKLRDNNTDALSIGELYQMWKKELDWVGSLIMRYVGREALWLHRRFLSLFFIKNWATDDQSSVPFYSFCKSDDISTFINDELKLLHFCTIMDNNNEFEDHQAQAIYCATYIMWLAKQMPESIGLELEKNSQYGVVKILLNNIGKSFLCDSK